MSFKLKTVLGVAAIEIALLAILVFSGIHYIRSSNEGRLVDQAHVAANLLATMTTDAAVSLDLATLDELTEQAVANPGIVYTRIRDAAGQVLSAAGDPDALSADFAEDDRIESTDADGRFDVSAPIKISGYDFGRVELGLSTTELDVTVAEARDWMFSIAATEILLVAIFGLLLGQILTQQLSRLQVSAKRVAEGDFGHQTQVTGRDELSQTARSFNRMSDALLRYKKASEEALAKAEAARATAESRLLEAIDAMPHGVAIVEDSGDIMHLNERYSTMYALPAHVSDDNSSFTSLITLQSQLVSQIPYGIDLPREEHGIGRASVERQRRLDDPESFPHWESRLTDGRVLLCTQQRMPSGGIVLVDSDVTELHEAVDRARALERELAQKQKLESLGTLAGGVAHEINTPIQFIGDNLNFLRDGVGDLFSCVDKLSDKLKLAGAEGDVSDILSDADIDFLRDELPDAADQSLTGVTRIRDIVSAVKVYSHPGHAGFSATDVNALVRAAAIVTKSRWKTVAELTEDLDPTLPRIQANEGQLNQVLVNLIVNAADAIEDAGQEIGKITVTTKQLADNKIELTIADNGPGVPKEIRDRVFDPFFTTKVVGKGSGQGLSISRSLICDSHGGEMTVGTSEMGGALFRMVLDISRPADDEENSSR